MVFLELRPLLDPAELDQAVARVAFIGGTRNLGLVGGGDQPELGELGVGHEIEGHEVGAAFLQGRVLLLERVLRLARAAPRRPCPKHGR